MTMTVPDEQVVIPRITRATRMRAARDTTGLNQEDFADSIGVSRRTVARWEGDNEGTPPKSYMLLVQMRTRVPVEWIATGEYTPRDLNPEPTVSGFRPLAILPLGRAA